MTLVASVRNRVPRPRASVGLESLHALGASLSLGHELRCGWLRADPVDRRHSVGRSGDARCGRALRGMCARRAHCPPILAPGRLDSREAVAARGAPGGAISPLTSPGSRPRRSRRSARLLWSVEVSIWPLGRMAGRSGRLSHMAGTALRRGRQPGGRQPYGHGHEQHRRSGAGLPDLLPQSRLPGR